MSISDHNTAYELQKFICDALKQSKELNDLSITFIPENSKDIEFEIKKNLQQQGLVGIVMTPNCSYIGHDGAGVSFDVEDLTLQIVEYVPINRASNRISCATGLDVANYCVSYLGGPQAAIGFGKLCPKGIEQGEDNGLLVTKATFDCAIDGGYGGEFPEISAFHVFNPYVTVDQISGLFDLSSLLSVDFKSIINGITDLSNDVTEISGDLVGVKDDIETLSDDLGDAKANIETLSDDVNDISSQLSNITPKDLSNYIPYTDSDFGKDSLTIGVRDETTWAGKASTVLGYKCYANGSYSMAQGIEAKAAGGYSHAEGVGTYAGVMAGHAEGWSTSCNTGMGSHSEGYLTDAHASFSHTEGMETYTGSMYSHAEGRANKITGTGSQASRAAGLWNTIQDGLGNDIAGISNVIKVGNYNSVAGYNNSLKGELTHIEGSNNYLSRYNENFGKNNHIEGASLDGAGVDCNQLHVEGENHTLRSYDNVAHPAEDLHIEGYKTDIVFTDSGTDSSFKANHFEGQNNYLVGYLKENSHINGNHIQGSNHKIMLEHGESLSSSFIGGENCRINGGLSNSFIYGTNLRVGDVNESFIAGSAYPRTNDILSNITNSFIFTNDVWCENITNSIIMGDGTSKIPKLYYSFLWDVYGNPFYANCYDLLYPQISGCFGSFTINPSITYDSETNGRSGDLNFFIGPQRVADVIEGNICRNSSLSIGTTQNQFSYMKYAVICNRHIGKSWIKNVTVHAASGSGVKTDDVKLVLWAHKASSSTYDDSSVSYIGCSLNSLKQTAGANNTWYFVDRYSFTGFGNAELPENCDLIIQAVPSSENPDSTWTWSTYSTKWSLLSGKASTTTDDCVCVAELGSFKYEIVASVEYYNKAPSGRILDGNALAANSLVGQTDTFCPVTMTKGKMKVDVAGLSPYVTEAGHFGVVAVCNTGSGYNKQNLGQTVIADTKELVICKPNQLNSYKHPGVVSPSLDSAPSDKIECDTACIGDKAVMKAYAPKSLSAYTNDAGFVTYADIPVFNAFDNFNLVSTDTEISILNGTIAEITTNLTGNSPSELTVVLPEDSDDYLQKCQIVIDGSAFYESLRTGLILTVRTYNGTELISKNEVVEEMVFKFVQYKKNTWVYKQIDPIDM